MKEEETLLNRFVVYETNITSIRNISTGRFYLNFTNKVDKTYCIFQKKPKTNLLLLCLYNETREDNLLATDEDIILDNINILYNFIITPITNNETFIVKKQKKLIFL